MPDLALVGCGYLGVSGAVHGLGALAAIHDPDLDAAVNVVPREVA